MATTITAGNATDGLKITPDNTGILELKTGTGAGTTALTLSTAQAATFAGDVSVTGNATLPTIRSNAASTPPTIQDSAGTQIGTFCRAWVNFDGTGTFSPNPSTTKIRASFNVSSITDNGTGSYIVNFTTAMPDTNYSVVKSDNFYSLGDVKTFNTNNVTVQSYQALGSVVDVSIFCVAIFR